MPSESRPPLIWVSAVTAAAWLSFAAVVATIALQRNLLSPSFLVAGPAVGLVTSVSGTALLRRGASTASREAYLSLGIAGVAVTLVLCWAYRSFNW